MIFYSLFWLAVVYRRLSVESGSLQYHFVCLVCLSLEKKILIGIKEKESSNEIAYNYQLSLSVIN